MKVAYCSLLLPEEKRLSERSKKRLSGISLHKFSQAIIKGLDENMNEPITIFNIINTLNYPNFPQLFFNTEKWHHNESSDDFHIGYINLFGIKYFTQSNNLYRKLKKWAKATEEECIVCVHHIYYPAMHAAIRLRKHFKKVKICLITGDMTGKYGLQAHEIKSIKSILTKRLEKKIDLAAKQFDCFVFATKDMADAFGVSNKPYVIVECAYTPPDYQNTTDTQKDTDKKILFYAGAIRNEYGIPHLLKAFNLINKDNYYLLLAGDGNAVSLVQEYAEKNKNIQYLGFVSPQRVDEIQHISTVNVNPRTSELSFVKYSFPSKSLDCLASGTPYIAHKLPCDPPEYETVIQYARNETDEALAEKIIEICEKSYEKRSEIGLKAIEFVKQHKNPVVMTRKIVELWESVITKK